MGSRFLFLFTFKFGRGSRRISGNVQNMGLCAQRMVPLMRALVGLAPLALLDDACSGMREEVVRAARRYLRDCGGVGLEQVVMVTHWEGEVPWGTWEGVRRFRLDGGVGRVVELGGMTYDEDCFWR